MKKITKKILLSISLLSLLSCAQRPKVDEGLFLVRGLINNVPDGEIIGLFKSEGSLFKEISRDTIENGYFEFLDSISPKDGTKEFGLVPRSEGLSQDLLPIWVKSGEYLEINGDDGFIKSWMVNSNISHNDEIRALYEAGIDETLEIARIDKEMDIFSAKARALRKEGNTEEFEEYVKLLDSLVNLSGEKSLIRSKKHIDYLLSAPITEIWINEVESMASFITNYQDAEFTLKVKELYNMLPPAILSSEVGQKITAYVNPPQSINIGDDMVDGDLFDTDGNKHNLSEFKGKYIMLDFWSIGCGPCHTAMPELEELMNTYADNLAIVAINCDLEEPWIEFINKRDLKGYQWTEGNQTAGKLYQSYNGSGFPHYVLISPEGKVLDIWMGYGEGSLKNKLKEYIRS